MVEQLSLPGMDVPPAESTTGRCSTIDLSQPPRLRHVDRAQVLMMLRSLDDSLPADHDALVIGDAVTQLNFEKFEAMIAARGSAPGRAATDPRILAALWLYAATKAVGSGREAQPEEVRVSTTDPHASKTRDSDFTIAWRQRMTTGEAKAIYKKRASTIEAINADLAEHPRGPRAASVPGAWPDESVVRGVVDRVGLQPHAIRSRPDHRGA